MTNLIRRASLLIIPAIAALVSHPASAAEAPPNVVVIFCDDLGYADVGCYGAKGYATPNIDRLAREGVKFTDFYVSSPVCSASRSALLTGCYHERVGIRGALGPKSPLGLGHEETTLAEMLKSKGYATGMAGKWHLGARPSQRPTKHGFDSFLGIPYSNDMWPHHPERPKDFPALPLYDGDKTAIADVTADDQPSFTGRFADRAASFIRENRDRPFFFYLAPDMPHVPLFASAKYKGTTERGLFGDVIAEIDGAVGTVLRALEETGVDKNTLVIFTSDNGPWLSYGDHAGSAAPLREGKGTCFEGGIREPFLARWPGRIPAGTVRREPAATIDILPTLAALAGADLPKRPIDGKDIRPLLFGEPDARAPHEALFFHYGPGQLHAMRSGRWKLQFPHTARSMVGQTPGKGGVPGKYRDLEVGLELYDLDADPGETTNVAAQHPDVVKQLQTLADAHRAELGDTLTSKRPGSAVRPADQAQD
ncbi:sulfatase family protein [Tundrisphaera sp. TA3]|uniref:sulfatase family protein n=1 Tax=Tundrisphaera sp. TA3 TaxID=3435775 RepID=UPI003EB8A767